MIMSESVAVPSLWGTCGLKSTLSLEEVGDILSQKVFAGARFGGRELDIREEVPAVFIDKSFMGLRVILMGYSGMEESKGFTVSIEPSGDFRQYLHKNKVERARVEMSSYLYYLLTEALQDNSEMQILEHRY
jgi:hypothetical protein